MNLQACRYLVCFAFEEEARAFRQRAFNDSSCHLLITGMGAARARQSMNILASIHPQLVLTCGFAGGLNPQLRLGEVVYNTDGDADLENKLARAGARPGRFLHVDRVICKSHDKLSLWRSTQADAVDMESRVIREAARASGIPSVTLRAISDVAGEDLPLDFNFCLHPNGKPRWPRLGAALLRQPSLIPRLIQMRKGFHLAATRLAAVLGSLVEESGSGRQKHI